jgi:hypothetical protein
MADRQMGIIPQCMRFLMISMACLRSSVIRKGWFFFSDNGFPHIMHTLCPKKGRDGEKNRIETI